MGSNPALELTGTSGHCCFSEFEVMFCLTPRRITQNA
jgi:hypothetical protein